MYEKRDRILDYYTIILLKYHRVLAFLPNLFTNLFLSSGCVGLAKWPHWSLKPTVRKV